MPAPLVLVLTSEIAAPGADTDILTAALVADVAQATNDIQIPTRWAGRTLRINISCVGTSIVKLVDDNDDEIHLKAGAAMVANQNHIEDFVPDPARTYNLQLDTTDGAINHLAILLVEHA